MSRQKKMMLISLAAALVLFIIALGAWWYLFFGKPNPPLSQTRVSVQSAQSSSSPSVTATSAPIVDSENPPLGTESLGIDGAAFTVEVASTALEQTRGLSFRPSLGAKSGMLFIFGNGSIQTFWMKDMNFPLDMIWISGNTVVGFAQDAPAPAPGAQLWELPIYTSPANTDKVLEVPAGTVAKYNIKVGDAVTIGPY
jgi:uncharacterized membrane protein (UPF0127 family)